ncbi:hypothetical protein LR69_04535 [Geobacillus sp. BCO2]|nr:hypothetical protein LR69_04535 [Geobacillus sp. BCO2]
MIQRAWELYVEHVKTGEMLTCDKGNEMRDQVFNEFFHERKEETKVIVKRERKEDEKFVENKKEKTK